MHSSTKLKGRTLGPAIALGFARDVTGAARAAHFRRLAHVHEREAARCDSAELCEMQLRLAQAYRALAENEEWLEGKPLPDDRPGEGAPT